MQDDVDTEQNNVFNQCMEDNKVLQKVESVGSLTNNNQNAYWIEELIQYSTKFTEELVKLRTVFTATEGELKMVADVYKLLGFVAIISHYILLSTGIA